MKLRKSLFALVAGLALASSTHAESYPNKPIRMIIPFPPGGATDMVGRIVAEGLSKELGQTVIVDNRTGGGGGIGTLALAKSAPDGYTIGIATVGSHAANPACNPKAGYDPVNDFAPISNLARTPNVLSVYSGFPAQDVKQIIEYAKKNPGKVSYATGGICGIHHLTGEQFTALTGTKMVHVPYRGSGPALIDVLAARVDMFFDSLPGSLQYIQSGKLRAVAVAWDKRLELLPNVPTYSELGLKQINDSVWYGLVAPAKTPDDVIRKLNAATLKVLAQPDVKAHIAQTGSEASGTTPAAYGAEIKLAAEKLSQTVKTRGIKLDGEGQ